MLDKTIIDEARMIRIEDELARRGLPFWIKPRHDNLGQPCPMCGGTDRFSVSIKKQVFNCRGCGAAGDVISLVQALDGTDFETAVATLAGPLPPFKPNGGRAPALKQVIAMRFDYEDEVGKLLYQVDRIEFQNQDGSFVLGGAGKRDKIFLPRRPNGSGGWITGKGCLDGVRRVPYRLPELIEALANGSMIVIVEGEAKVDLLRGWNVPATCNVGGSGNSKIWKEHARFLFKPGADVVVLPDNDEAGRKHVDAVARSLIEAGAAVRVLELPALPPNGDVINWAAAGGTADELHALIASHARPYACDVDGAAPADDGAADSLGAKVESNTNPTKLLSYAEMVSLPSTDWLIEGLVPRRSKSVAFGQSDTFKSFLAADMACSVSTGHTWHGKRVRQCKAIYLANEGAIGVGRKRIPAWMAYHDVSPEDRQNIFLVKVETILPNPVSLANLIAAIRTIVEPGEDFFLIVDVLRGTMSGSESDDEAAHAWTRAAEILIDEGATILTVTHSPYSTDDRARGSSHLWGSFDTRLQVEADKEKLTAVLKVNRHKDYDSSGEWGFQLVPQDIPEHPDETSLVPRLDAEASPKAKRKGKSDPSMGEILKRQYLETYYRLADSVQKTPGYDGKPVIKVSTYEIREEMKLRGFLDKNGKGRGGLTEAARTALSKAKATLINAGELVEEADFIWRP